MTVTITWLGHSAFAISLDGHPVLTDPFLNGNPLAPITAEEAEAELIFLSHAHGDHLGDTVAIAQRTGAKVVANFEICNWLNQHGVASTHAQQPGGGWDHGLVHARWTVAFHSSSFPDGSYGGEPNGFVLTYRGKKLYFAGDTALFGDMKLIGDLDLDVAFLPIGDNYTMGPEDSLRAVQLLRPRYVIPMHYKTFPLIDQNAGSWANQVSSETGATPVVLDPGKPFTLG